MLTVNTRAAIIILYVISGILLFSIDITRRKEFKKRCLTFIKYTIAGFPVIDLFMIPSEMNMKVLEFITLTFFLLNIKNFHLNKLRKPEIVIILFFFVLIMSGLNSYFTSNSIYETLKLTSYLILFLIFKKAIRIKTNLPEFLFKGLAIWLVLFFILQLLFGINFSFYYALNEQSIIEQRYTSFAQDPQKMAQIAYMLSILFIGLTLKKSKNISPMNFLFFILTLAVGLSQAPVQV